MTRVLMLVLLCEVYTFCFVHFVNHSNPGGAKVLLVDIQFDDAGRVLGFMPGGIRTISNSSVSPYTGSFNHGNIMCCIGL